ncbi:MAG: lysoplasmalogenase [Alphaproteobacteria bacterium]|nr:lysoplasmalogenase [Alphaproteobacteria bacterium]
MIGVAVATALCMAVLVACEYRHHLVGKAVSKTLASAGFVAMGVLAGLPLGTPAQIAVFVGLLFGAAGDLFLLSREKRWFLAGLGSFLLNHVAYVVAFGLLGVRPLLALGAAVPLVGIAYVVWRWLSARVGSMAKPVMAYIAVISAMVACAAGALDTAGPVLLGAAVLFFASDLCVARDRFVSPGPENRLVGLPLYYGAQLLFAWGAG